MNHNGMKRKKSKKVDTLHLQAHIKQKKTFSISFSMGFVDLKNVLSAISKIQKGGPLLH